MDRKILSIAVILLGLGVVTWAAWSVGGIGEIGAAVYGYLWGLVIGLILLSWIDGGER